jgi:hypothetical protein
MIRFNDEGKYGWDFGNYRIVICPGCQKPVDCDGSSLACTHCGYSKTAPLSDSLVFVIGLDNYLSIPCCGHVLTAANTEYLIFLEGYVTATLRERVPNLNKSTISRLPQWIKDKNNREEILKCIKKLRVRLEKDGYVPNTIFRG